LSLSDRRHSRVERDDPLARLVTISEPYSPASEAYRTLRTNLLYTHVDNPPKVLVISSPGPREGKSTICANLGVVLAQLKKNVLMIDCDLRRPVLHKILGLRNLLGLVNVLAEEHSPQEVWHEPLAGLRVLTVGPIPPNPADLLSSQRFAEFIRQATGEFDYVLIDSSPIEVVSDYAVLATLSDGVLLVIDAQTTRKAAVRRSIRRLETVGANMLGTVLNNVKVSQEHYDYSSYSYEEVERE
jgi:capsular exopolysaccharide synthesis family protein